MRFEFVPMVFSNLDNCHSLQKVTEFFFEDSQWSSVYAFETPWVFLGLKGRGQRRLEKLNSYKGWWERLLDVAVRDIGGVFYVLETGSLRSSHEITIPLPFCSF